MCCLFLQLSLQSQEHWKKWRKTGATFLQKKAARSGFNCWQIWQREASQLIKFHIMKTVCVSKAHTQRRRSGVNLAQVLHRASAKQMRTAPSLKSSFQPDKFKQSNFRPNCTCSTDVPSSAVSSRKTTICRVIWLKWAQSLAAVGCRAKLMHLAAHACLFATRSLGINAVLILRLPSECFVRNVSIS